MFRIFTAVLILVFISACSPKSETPEIPKGAQERVQSIPHHAITISLNPSAHTLEAVDTFTIPKSMAVEGMKVLINADLKVEKTNGDVNFKLVAENRNANDIGMDRDNDSEETRIKVNVYELTGLNKTSDTVMTLSLSGQINNQVAQEGEEYGRGFSSSPGLIEERGIYLSGATYWVPTIPDSLITYNIEVTLPEGWSSVSQGKLGIIMPEKGPLKETWDAPTPSEEIYIIAAKFTKYEIPVGNVTAMAYLRTPDEAMANKYLETTAQYMEMYRELIGPYPYTKFALVENFWETGYGMPSFTLLGSQIIRFPFILHSSYPHELLHNWWGNSVYIDFDSGNWAEGLTAYMADHLVAEGRGTGADHRRAILQRYTNYVTADNDFALTDFTGRTDGPTEAIGYGKTAMVFDMLRGQVGDDNFKLALSRFYRNKKYQVGTWTDIRKEFEGVSDKDFGPFFEQWVSGVGAPELAIEKAAMEGDKLTLLLQQNQLTSAFNLEVPIALYTKDNVSIHTVSMSKQHQVFSIPTDKPIVRVDIDPQFNLFRRLHWAEISPSFSQAFGADKVLIILPTRTSPSLNARYSKLAGLWGSRENVTIVKDSGLTVLPTGTAIWVFGQNNKFYGHVKHALTQYGSKIDGKSVHFGSKKLSLVENSSIIAVRNPSNPKAVIVGLTAHSDAAVAGLARKLPHYGKYSYLAFEGDAPTNTAKGQWPSVGSPLTAILDKRITSFATLEKRPALAVLKPVFNSKRMMGIAKELTSKPYEGRGVGTKGLDKAADYIAAEFRKAGIEPGGDAHTYFQNFTMEGPDGKTANVKNIVAIIRGTNPKFQGQSVVLSAHYDHLGFGWPNVREKFAGQLHPGADDNASGIAVLIEMAHTLAKSAPERTIVLLAPTGEEAGLVGARHYLKNTKAYPAPKIFANVNLDAIGRAGEKFMIFGSNSAREWPFIFMGTTATTGVKTDLVKQAVNASDHTAFLEANIPAIHIFGAPHNTYHRPSDTFATLDAGSLMRAATLTKEVVAYLGSRQDPMTNQISPAKEDDNKPKPTMGDRKVSTGSMPDFTFKGEGVKLSNVTKGSAADKAGLKIGDVIKTLGGVSVPDLRTYSDQLKTYKPGDKVEMIIDRSGKEMTLSITMGAR